MCGCAAFQGAALTGTDACPYIAALIAREATFIEVGAHACVVHARGAVNTDSPLRLQLAPVAPGAHIARPEEGLGLGRTGSGSKHRGDERVGLVLLGWLMGLGVFCKRSGERR